MEELKEHPLIKFPPDTLYQVRKLYNLEQPGRMKEAIDILEEWIKQQDHFESKNFERNYLEILIILCKGSLEKAKMKLDKICTMRTLAPEFFEIEPMEVKLNRTRSLCCVMPRLTPEYYKIYVTKILPEELNADDQFNALKDMIIGLEFQLRMMYFLGFINIIDFRGCDMKEILVALNFSQVRRYINIIREGYGVRIFAVHLLSDSKLVENVVALCRSIMPGKLAKRVYSHSSLETLYEMVPRELLCKDLGGDEPPLQELHNLRIKAITSKEHQEYMKEVLKQRTDESKRIGGKIDEGCLHGTFRSLNVD